MYVGQVLTYYAIIHQASRQHLLILYSNSTESLFCIGHQSAARWAGTLGTVQNVQNMPHFREAFDVW